MRPGWYRDPEGSGRERWWNGREWTVATRNPVQAAASNRRGMRMAWVAGGILLMMVLSVLRSGDIEEDSPRSDAALTAYIGCQQEIEELLVAPSTAEYSPTYSDAVTPLGGNRYQVDVAVDSENGFGAMLRTNVRCVIEHLGGDRYRLEDMTTS